MRREAAIGVEADLARARREFERWRLRRRRGERIPERLWEAAVEVAHAHGVSKASLALHLDYYGLQRRLAARTPEGRRRPRSAARFVELALPAGTCQARCHVELSDAVGSPLRVDVSGLSARELATFVRVVAGQEVGGG